MLLMEVSSIAPTLSNNNCHSSLLPSLVRLVMGGTLNSLCSHQAYELGGVQRGVGKWEIGQWRPDQADVTPKHAH